MDKKAFLVIFLVCWGAVYPQLLFAENLSVDIGASVPATSSGGGGGGGGGGSGGSSIVSNPIASFLGKASAENKIVLLKDGQVVASISAGADGSFQFNVSGLSAGNYTFGLYAEDGKGKRSPLLSIPTQVAGSGVTAINNIVVPAPTLDIAEAQAQDINSDGKINLIDFSIMAFWYGKSSPPENVDLNADGKMNLIDFSILAYYWTG